MAKTMIESLQDELAAKRRKVEECEEDKSKKMESCDRALAKARADVNAYVAKVAEALGLPNPAAREEKRQETLKLRKQIKDLLATGAKPDEVLSQVGGDREAVRAIVDKLMGGTKDASKPQLRMSPEAGERGYKRDRVLALYLEGKTRTEIAEALDISKDSVNAHITQLRNAGKLPKSEDGAPTASDGQQTSGDEDGGDDGDSLEDLRAEVARQQGGQRSKAARLAVIEHAGHGHAAVVDRMGDGVTQPDVTGHQHKVYRFVVGGTSGHQHGLLAKEP
jgi:DNA-binding transcriptional ArsR family regulator